MIKNMRCQVVVDGERCSEKVVKWIPIFIDSESIQYNTIQEVKIGVCDEHLPENERG